MDISNLFKTIGEIGVKNIFFMLFTFLFAIFYFFYALVIAKQVKVMDKALQDKYNWLVIFITSLQVTVSLILLIILILTTFFL